MLSLNIWQGNKVCIIHLFSVYQIGQVACLGIKLVLVLWRCVLKLQVKVISGKFSKDAHIQIIVLAKY